MNSAKQPVVESTPTPASMGCEVVELSTIRNITDALSIRILESGYHPDVIVAIARGGLVPARFIADSLNVSSITTMTVRHYHAGAVKNEGAYIAHSVNSDVRGKRVLIVDDVNDTGETFDVALPHIQSLSPAQVKTAVIHEKQISSFRADFAGEAQEQWRWLIYPWALVEDVGSFILDIAPAAGNIAELRQLLFERYGLRLTKTTLKLVLRLNELNYRKS